MILLTILNPSTQKPEERFVNPSAIEFLVDVVDKDGYCIIIVAGREYRVRGYDAPELAELLGWNGPVKK